jgi:hypothetical protein
MESEQYLHRNSSAQSDHVRRMHDLISQYEVTSDIHVSRTLDQSYYDVMDNTRIRDHDQVVYRYTREKSLRKVRPNSKLAAAYNHIYFFPEAITRRTNRE